MVTDFVPNEKGDARFAVRPELRQQAARLFDADENGGVAAAVGGAIAGIEAEELLRVRCVTKRTFTLPTSSAFAEMSFFQVETESSRARATMARSRSSGGGTPLSEAASGASIWVVGEGSPAHAHVAAERAAMTHPVAISTRHMLRENTPPMAPCLDVARSSKRRR